ncbi:excisionase [Faecalibaculum rodentium]|uniref:excisionase n=1 Tax=Faecalibaculum rodentium TaxID=1702221 RepID=UPI0025B7397C|nr:excisionase [Faecalibaculum rodentium]
MAEEVGISVKDKVCLTIEKASRYFGIGEKKLRRLVNSNLDSGFVIQNGVKILIKRQRFEQFLDNLPSI